MEDQRQYMMLYVPKRMIDLMHKGYLLLMGLNGNYGRIFQMILPKIVSICEELSRKREAGEDIDIRDYEWQLTIVPKERKWKRKK